MILELRQANRYTKTLGGKAGESVTLGNKGFENA